MKIKDAYEHLCREYLSKCAEYGCDSCVASIYCTLNKLRGSRAPSDPRCVQNLQAYFRDTRWDGTPKHKTGGKSKELWQTDT